MTTETELCTCDRAFGWHSFVCPARTLNNGKVEGKEAAWDRKMALLMVTPLAWWRALPSETDQ